MHVRGLMEDNLPIPAPQALSEYMAVAV
jgi:predicted RNase H-like HicB family nuclease